MTPFGAAVVLALGAMVCAGLGDLVYKQGALAGTPSRHLLMVQAWFFAPTVVMYGLVTRTLSARPVAVWGALAGGFAFIAFYNFAKSLETGRVSTNAPIFRLSFVLTAFLAVLFLGEPLTVAKAVGLAGVLVTVWLLVGAPAGDDRRVPRRLASLLRVAVPTAAIGISNFLYKIGLQAGATAASLLAAQTCVVTLSALALVLTTDGHLRVGPVALRHGRRAGLVIAVSFICLTESLARGQASVTVPIAQMGFVVTAIAGSLLLNEPLSWRKKLGLTTAACAVASLAMG